MPASLAANPGTTARVRSRNRKAVASRLVTGRLVSHRTPRRCSDTADSGGSAPAGKRSPTERRPRRLNRAAREIGSGWDRVRRDGDRERLRDRRVRRRRDAGLTAGARWPRRARFEGDTDVAHLGHAAAGKCRDHLETLAGRDRRHGRRAGVERCITACRTEARPLSALRRARPRWRRRVPLLPAQAEANRHRASCRWRDEGVQGRRQRRAKATERQSKGAGGRIDLACDAVTRRRHRGAACRVRNAGRLDSMPSKKILLAGPSTVERNRL